MPYATNNRIGTDPIDGGIEITEQQYQDAIAGMMAGKLVSIDGGFAIIDQPAPPAPEPVPEPEPTSPPDLLPYQFRAMLALSGKQADLDAYIAALPDPQKTIAQAKLDYSLIFRRDNDLVLAAQQALGLTDAQLDALWTSAAQIT